jgi:uncharacterized membrane protein
MRPKSIARFEGLSLVSVALGALAAILTRGGSIPGAAERAAGATMLVAVTVIGLAISLALILLTSRKASNVAKWLLIVFVALGAAMTLPQLGATASEGLVGVANVASVVLQIVAIFFLFTPEARAWFEGRGGADGSDIRS